jgi:flavorubredoxin
MIARDIMNPLESSQMSVVPASIEQMRVSALAAEIARISMIIAGTPRP